MNKPETGKARREARLFYFVPLYSLGDIPVISLNTRLNVDWFLNPHSYEISVIDISLLFQHFAGFRNPLRPDKLHIPDPELRGEELRDIVFIEKERVRHGVEREIVR